jgi:hypothetical protein
MAHTFFLGHLFNHYQGLHHTFFFRICTKCYAVFLSDPSCNRIRPDTWLHIKGHKNQHAHPAMWNFVHWLPRYSSIISCTITSCYYNCCTDGSISPRNYRYPFVEQSLLHALKCYGYTHGCIVDVSSSAWLRLRAGSIASLIWLLAPFGSRSVAQLKCIRAKCVLPSFLCTFTTRKTTSDAKYRQEVSRQSSFCI